MAIFGVAVIGGGAFWGYKRWQKAKEQKYTAVALLDESEDI